MTKPPTNERPPWRQTPLTVAILAALPGAATVLAALAAVSPENLVGPEFRVNTSFRPPRPNGGGFFVGAALAAISGGR